MEDEILDLNSELPEGTKLVAVSKFQPTEAVLEAYEAGQRIFGESRAQEMVQKYEELSQVYLDISWHFIGHLQTNKVKYIAPFVDMIESVDSLRLLEAINNEAEKNKRRIPILLELHVAEEDSKSGLSEDELWEIIQELHQNPDRYDHIRLDGLMAMASNTDDEEQIRREFAKVQSLFNEIKESGLILEPEHFDELSIGMSGDYQIALEYGATLVRIGSKIFGTRA